MPIENQSREGDVTAVNTETNLNSLGSQTLNEFKVPADAKRIKKIRVVAAFGPDGTASDQDVAIVRLKGNGLKVQQDLIVGGCGVGGGTPAGSENHAAIYEDDDADIEVVPGNTIQASGEIAGDDVSPATIGVQLGFEY